MRSASLAARLLVPAAAFAAVFLVRQATGHT